MASQPQLPSASLRTANAVLPLCSSRPAARKFESRCCCSCSSSSSRPLLCSVLAAPCLNLDYCFRSCIFDIF
uniref:Uncharacterized protein n=1 Tax=Oryza brachyantha TaxID=4533 RepID=J3LQ81_ORYBR